VAVQLATAFARQGLRTVLVDANLRRPKLHEHFKVPGTSGLSNDALTPLETDVPKLRVLPSGPPPARLAPDRMRRVLEALRQDSDVVVLDSPALSEAPDGLELAVVADAVVWVVAPGLTERDATRTRVLLERAHARATWVVLNSPMRRH
jgi:tyrosine-protein kinase Etk/Wzc